MLLSVNQEHCSGEDSDEIFFTGDLAGTQYDWLNDNVSIGLVGLRLVTFHPLQLTIAVILLK